MKNFIICEYSLRRKGTALQAVDAGSIAMIRFRLVSRKCDTITTFTL